MKVTDERVLANQSEAGMTLLEVMVSLVVMGITLVALSQGLTLGIRMNTESKTRLTNLGLCKRVTESLKSQIEATQATFDGANTDDTANRSFYVDPDGKEIPQGTTANDGSRALFRVTAVVNDWRDEAGNALTQTDSNGIPHVLVKTLDVVVLAQQSAISSNDSAGAAGSSREIKLRVEIARPSAE